MFFANFIVVWYGVLGSCFLRLLPPAHLFFQSLGALASASAAHQCLRSHHAAFDGEEAVPLACALPPGLDPDC